MASRIRNRSVLSVASRAEITELRYCTRPIAARIEISEITISSSTSVNPSLERRRATFNIVGLPVLVFRAVERLAVGLRVDVEHVAAGPGGRIGFVGVGTHAPFRRVGHRID